MTEGYLQSPAVRVQLPASSTVLRHWYRLSRADAVWLSHLVLADGRLRTSTFGMASARQESGGSDVRVRSLSRPPTLSD